MTQVVMGRSLDSRRRLIDSAAELFHAGGYASTGVKGICDRAEVHKGSFYHFFPSKQDLAIAVLDDNWEAFKSQGLDPIFTEGGCARDRVQRLFDVAFEGHSAIKAATGHVRGCAFGNLAVEASTLEEPIRLRLVEIFEEWARYLEAALQDAKDAGELRKDIDPAATAWGVLASLQGLLLLAKTTNDTSQIPIIGAEVVDHLWA